MYDFTENEFYKQVEIGSGGHGIVYKAYSERMDTVAIKVFHYNVNLEEIEVMRKLMEHPNIINVFGTIKLNNPFTPRNGYVMEYMSQGSVHDVIHVKHLNYSTETAYSWSKQAAKAILFLHENKVIHRNIKPTNMLVSDSLTTLQLSDFGISFPQSLPNAASSYRESNYVYTAPEAIADQNRYDRSIDVFSLAITMWEIIHRRSPYRSIKTDNTIALMIEVSRGLRPSLEQITDSDMASLLNEAWNADPEKRPSMDSIVTFFKNSTSKICNTSSIPDTSNTQEKTGFSTTDSLAVNELPHFLKLLISEQKSLISESGIAIMQKWAKERKRQEQTDMNLVEELKEHGVGDVIMSSDMSIEEKREILKHKKLEKQCDETNALNQVMDDIRKMLMVPGVGQTYVPINLERFLSMNNEQQEELLKMKARTEEGYFGMESRTTGKANEESSVKNTDWQLEKKQTDKDHGNNLNDCIE